MTSHRLEPLLHPRSIAVVGASQREGSAGHGMLAGLIASGFSGPLYPVNPRYEEIQGLACYGTLRDLPEPVDMAVLGVNSTYLEQQLDDAIAMGARSATIFDTCYLDGESDRGLLSRLKARAREAGMPVCGGNGMGYLNMDAGIPVTIYDASDKVRESGHVTFITHSGTVFSEIGLNDFRYRCNLLVSCGQEINGTVADYMDYALELPSTRVIALFMEEARDPEGFMRALAKAQERAIPVVAMKVGKSESAARFATIHSNADAGDDAAYQAVFDRFGVLRVASMDQMANLLTLLSHDRQLGPGGLGVVLDSGGEREMFVDQAEETGVPLATISSETAERIRPHLHHALEPVNPLDAWGTAANYEDDFEGYFAAMAGDPDVSLVTFCGDFQWNPTTEKGYAKALVATLGKTEKPIAALINTPMSGMMTAGRALTQDGVIALCGTRESLIALRHALKWRDRAGKLSPAPAPDGEALARLRTLLGSGQALDAEASKALLKEFGIESAADAGGHTVKLTFTMLHDRQFGPLIEIRTAGNYGKLLDEFCLALPGFDEEHATALINRMRVNRMLRNSDGWPNAAHAAFAALLARFGAMATELADLADMIEVGPVHVIDGRAVASGVRVRQHRAA
jgi:acyl-CoA synthetase (NDP forming)